MQLNAKTKLGLGTLFLVKFKSSGYRTFIKRKIKLKKVTINKIIIRIIV